MPDFGAACFHDWSSTPHNQPMQDFQTPGFSFHIEGGDPRLNAVPATILAQILENTQRAFELIGIHVEGRAVRQRARVSASTSERFKLLCKVPRVGCYEVPIVLAPPTELYAAEQSQRALEVFTTLMTSVSRRDAPATLQAIPDERIRRRVLELVRGMAPRPGDHWSVDIRDLGGNSFARLDDTTAAFVQETLVPAEQREVERVITGELSNIAFTAHKFTIIYRPTNRELECIYDESVEDLLYACRRALIQVTGRVLEDEQGNPKQLIDVSDVRDLDLSVVSVTQSTFKGRTILKKGAPLILEPSFDEAEQLMCLESSELRIDVFAHTREGLLIELAEQLDMLWQEFATASLHELDPKALALRTALLEQFQEVAHAA